jgi:MFS transporter, BCD family, chlorophyll transporter
MVLDKVGIGLRGALRNSQEWLRQHSRVAYWLKILRLGLFQFGMGLSLAPITGTLNRVLIDELGIPAVAVGLLIAIHYFVSPTRALIGFRSDQERAKGNWRTPYLVLGAMLTYGGLSTAPFSLILLSGDGSLSFVPAMIMCTLIFLAYGLGVNIVETIYLATVSDVTPPAERGKVLAVLWGMLVFGTVVGSLIIGQLLLEYSHYRLIQAMQGTAVIFIALTFISMFGQERLKSNGQLVDHVEGSILVRETLLGSLRLLARQRLLMALFAVLFIATLGFSTHDVLLEPYGGQVLGMSVAATTRLTAWWGGAMLLAIGLAAWLIWQRRSPVLLIMLGGGVGALGFVVVSLAGGAEQVALFRGGVALIGLGRGLFIVGSLAVIMSLVDNQHAGLFLGLWGVMQALAQGIGTISGGLSRDIAQSLSGSVLTGYTVVYSASALLLSTAVLLIILLRLDRRMRSGGVRSPWSELGQVNADQIIF